MQAKYDQQIESLKIKKLKQSNRKFEKDACFQ